MVPGTLRTSNSPRHSRTRSRPSYLRLELQRDASTPRPRRKATVCSLSAPATVSELNGCVARERRVRAPGSSNPPPEPSSHAEPLDPREHWAEPLGRTRSAAARSAVPTRPVAGSSAAEVVDLHRRRHRRVITTSGAPSTVPATSTTGTRVRRRRRQRRDGHVVATTVEIVVAGGSWWWGKGLSRSALVGPWVPAAGGRGRRAMVVVGAVIGAEPARGAHRGGIEVTSQAGGRLAPADRWRGERRLSRAPTGGRRAGRRRRWHRDNAGESDRCRTASAAVRAASLIMGTTVPPWLTSATGMCPTAAAGRGADPGRQRHAIHEPTAGSKCVPRSSAAPPSRRKLIARL
jgi:hypothetical protein